MQIALFGATLPEIRIKLRASAVLIGAGAALLSPFAWLLTDAGPHLAAGPVYLSGALSLAAGLALEALRRRRASGQ